MLYKMSVKLAKKLVEHSEDKKEDIYLWLGTDYFYDYRVVFDIIDFVHAV